MNGPAPGGPSPAAPTAPVGLIDQHGHPLLHGELGLGAVERHLARAVTGSADGTAVVGSFFDSRFGLALRRWCPPLLGLPSFSSPVVYLARRRALGGHAAMRALLRGSGIETLMVSTDTPHPGDWSRGRWSGAATRGAASLPGGRLEVEEETTTAAELSAATGGRVREVIALERLAGRLADTSGSLRAFLRNLEDGVTGAARTAVAFTCGADQLATLPGRPTDPGELRGAVDDWLSARRAARAAPSPTGARAAMPPPELLHRSLHAVWAAGRPVQLRCTDPVPLAPLLREGSRHGAVVLLPEAPHHRAAARLAAILPRVYADVGPEPRETLTEAPFGKLLFTTRAQALPELHVVRARQFVQEMERLLGEWTARGECTPAEARRIIRRIGAENARRLYQLGEPAGD